MTPTEEAHAVVRRYCDAWLAGDIDTLLGCYAEGFTLHYFGDNPFTGDHVGKDAAVTTLLEVMAKADRELLAVDEITAGPNAAVAVTRERLTRDGEAHELRRVLRFRIDGGQLQECWLYDEDQALIDRLWR